MFIKDGKRFNILASATIGDVTYPNFLDPALRSSLGITEVADPAPPDDYDPDLYYRTEQDDVPYVIFTKKSDDQVAAILAARQQLVDDQVDHDEIKAIPFVNFLVTKRPAQIAARIHNDIATDGVEAVIIKLTKVLSILAKATLR